MLVIGVDYGMNTGDLPTYVVVDKTGGMMHILESGLLDDFDYEMYSTMEHKIVGEYGDKERFNEQFKTN